MAEAHKPAYEDDSVPEIYDGGYIGLHQDNLFDQDERVVDGALYDEATGKRYDNSTATDEGLFQDGDGRIGHIIVDPEGEATEDKEMDEAAAWLAEYDVSSDQQSQPAIKHPEITLGQATPAGKTRLKRIQA